MAIFDAAIILDISVGERGSALVEFGIASTIVLTLIFGIVDFGRALYTYHLVSNAARLGSRYAIVHGSDCTATDCPADATAIQTFVRTQAPGIDPNALTVTTTWSNTAGCRGAPFTSAGCLVAVQVSYPFTFLVPLLPSFTLAMNSTSQMIISQ
ncbi:MAG: TadE/TadG family type IV pilus assembly protein [Candidatus Velthaea sp.]